MLCCARYDHAFLRNTRARALANSLKFGVSHDDTLAWMDVLCMQVRTSAMLFRIAVGGCVMPAAAAPTRVAAVTERRHGWDCHGSTSFTLSSCLCWQWRVPSAVPPSSYRPPRCGRVPCARAQGQRDCCSPQHAPPDGSIFQG